MIKKPFIQLEENISFDDSELKFEKNNEVLVKNEESDMLVLYTDFNDQQSDESSRQSNISEFSYDNDHDYNHTHNQNSIIIHEEIETCHEEPNTKNNNDNIIIEIQTPTIEHDYITDHNRQDEHFSNSNDSEPEITYMNVQPMQQVSNFETTNESSNSSSQDLIPIYVAKNPSTRDNESSSVVRPLNRPKGSTHKAQRTQDVPKINPIIIEKLRRNVTGDQTSKELNKAKSWRIKKNQSKELDSTRTGHYNNSRRLTRSYSKSIEHICPSINSENQIGKMVWGFCKGWWPAIIIAATDVGIEPKLDKVCVYWIGEDLFSLLNNKTHVEPISSNLDARLIKYLKENEVDKDRKKACFVTLKLFSKYLKIPLIKPHAAWAEKNLMGKNNINDLVFYPFPKHMQERLDQLKQKNIKAAKKKALGSLKTPNESCSPNQEPPDSLEVSDKNLKGNGRRSNKFPRDYVKTQSSKDLLINSPDHHILPLVEQKPGVIVWGKISGHNWWPAMIVHYNDCGMREPNFGCQWIIWYGDHQLSQVHYQSVMKFEEGIQKMLNHISQSKKEVYIDGVLNACKDYCARLNYDTSKWTMSDVLIWISTLNNDLKTTTVVRSDDGRLESRYSTYIAQELNKIKANQEVAAEREKKIKSCDSLKAVFAGRLDILEVLCVSCLKICHNSIHDHPFFECVLCNDCLEEFKATIFAYGDDGKCFYCTLCTGSDTVVICDSYDCPRVYCTACLKYLISPKEYDEILIRDPWLCFLCDNAPNLNINKIFKPRPDWKTRLGQLFHTNLDISWKNVWNNIREKKKMRVLSLFDGISTGLLALDNLDISVEVYYAAEIDVDAKTVSKVYFGERIHHFGNVRNITRNEIEKIAPIDLLIGGSPCNDLSLANPNRLGLHDPNGTGVLFFDYCRIKKLVTEANNGHHLFWLFENVASMPSRYKLAINESLQCEPSLVDASDFSPQHRPRLFWSNLPIGINFPPPDPRQNLETVLTPNCKRHALVKKIRTVTTKVNSLKQGVSLLKPVLMDGDPDSLWITELEEIFGLPKHFTDVKNLSATKRQKLIGQSWSVQTITAILRPLCYFFISKTRKHN